jgi:hypothetical protein
MIGHEAILTGNFNLSRRRISPVGQLKPNTPIDQVLELLTEQDSDGLAEAIGFLSDAAKLLERERFLKAAP